MAITPFKAAIGGSRRTGLDRDLAANVARDMGKIIDNFRQWANHMQQGAGDVLIEALNPTFEKSQEIVPVRTGELKDSGYLEETTFRNQARVEMGYAKGGQPPYAIQVHEDVEVFHHEPTQAKFLQQPLEQDEQEIQQRIQVGFKQLSGT